MAVARPVASGTGNSQVVNTSAEVVGVAVRETAGSPGAFSFVLRDGTAVTDPIKYVHKGAASEHKAVQLPPIKFTTGVFLHRESGTNELVVYTTA